jgi:hypothetical protein
VDGRSKVAKHMKAIRTELAQHCGGASSDVELRLIDLAAWLSCIS